MESGGETQVRGVSGGNKRAGKELISWEEHWEHGWAIEGDAAQVFRETRVG